MSDSMIEQLEEEIKQLEALKDGTTPGPWQWSDHRVPDLIGDGLWPIVIEADHDGGQMGDCTLELHITDEDKRLIAAAPALVDALIAEKQAHQKLRAEIEGFRGSCIESAETLELNAMTAYSPEACETASTVERDTAAALTRILEADNG